MAAKYIEQGFVNVGVLDGGINAWQEAGFPLVQAA